MKLTENKILVKVENEKVSAGGIFIPEVNKTVGIVCGTVVSAGPGRLNPYTGVRVENNVKPGDRVIFNIGTALPVTVTKKKGNDFNSEKYFFTNDVEVDCILDVDEII